MMALAILSAGIQSSLEPAGEHAAHIARLWDFFLVVCAVVFVLTMLALLYAVLHKRGAEPVDGTARAKTTVTIATVATVITLFALLVSSIVTGRAIAKPHVDKAPESQIVVTGHQWWWQIEYTNHDQSKRFLTANEIVVPVGVPVNLHLRSTDVIHSLWVPNLNGKQDLIPGHDGSINFVATRPGIFRGQCAEFCGEQHAKMALWVNAVPPEQYSQWVALQQTSSRMPSTPLQRKGQEVFMSSPCPLCHTIRGTNANGNTAPDLTHFASRRSIAAGTLPNRTGDLAGWIIDPQHIKPGAYMPTMLMHKGELEPLLAYLESLQ